MERFNKEHPMYAEEAARRMVYAVVAVGKRSPSETIVGLSTEFERLLKTGAVHVGLMPDSKDKDFAYITARTDYNGKTNLQLCFDPKLPFDEIGNRAQQPSASIGAPFIQVMSIIVGTYWEAKAREN